MIQNRKLSRFFSYKSNHGFSDAFSEHAFTELRTANNYTKIIEEFGGPDRFSSRYRAVQRESVRNPLTTKSSQIF